MVEEAANGGVLVLEWGWVVYVIFWILVFAIILRVPQFCRSLIKLCRHFLAGISPNYKKRVALIQWIEKRTECKIDGFEDIWNSPEILSKLVYSVIPMARPVDSNDEASRRLSLLQAQRLVSRYLTVRPMFLGEELKKPWNKRVEKKFIRYISLIKSSIDNLEHEIKKDDENEYVVRGMGIITATKGESASFFIYSRHELNFDSLEVIITGPNEDEGRMKVGEVNEEDNTIKINSVVIEKKGGVEKKNLKVSYVPNYSGGYVVNICKKGYVILGSPFMVMVEENRKKYVKKEASTKEETRIINRVVDFVNEKMLLTDKGELIKISSDKGSVTRRYSEQNDVVMAMTKLLKNGATPQMRPTPEVFLEICEYIIKTCQFILRNTSCVKGLQLINDANKVIDGRSVLLDSSQIGKEERIDENALSEESIKSLVQEEINNATNSKFLENLMDLNSDPKDKEKTVHLQKDNVTILTESLDDDVFSEENSDTSTSKIREPDEDKYLNPNLITNRSELYTPDIVYINLLETEDKVITHDSERDFPIKSAPGSLEGKTLSPTHCVKKAREFFKESKGVKDNQNTEFYVYDETSFSAPGTLKFSSAKTSDQVKLDQKSDVLKQKKTGKHVILAEEKNQILTGNPQVQTQFIESKSSKKRQILKQKVTKTKECAPKKEDKENSKEKIQDLLESKSICEGLNVPKRAEINISVKKIICDFEKMLLHQNYQVESIIQDILSEQINENPLTSDNLNTEKKKLISAKKKYNPNNETEETCKIANYDPRIESESFVMEQNLENQQFLELSHFQIIQDSDLSEMEDQGKTQTILPTLDRQSNQEKQLVLLGDPNTEEIEKLEKNNTKALKDTFRTKSIQKYSENDGRKESSLNPILSIDRKVNNFQTELLNVIVAPFAAMQNDGDKQFTTCVQTEILQIGKIIVKAMMDYPVQTNFVKEVIKQISEESICMEDIDDCLNLNREKLAAIDALSSSVVTNSTVVDQDKEMISSSQLLPSNDENNQKNIIGMCSDEIVDDENNKLNVDSDLRDDKNFDNNKNSLINVAILDNDPLQDDIDNHYHFEPLKSENSISTNVLSSTDMKQEDISNFLFHDLKSTAIENGLNEPICKILDSRKGIAEKAWNENELTESKSQKENNASCSEIADAIKDPLIQSLEIYVKESDIKLKNTSDINQNHVKKNEENLIQSNGDKKVVPLNLNLSDETGLELLSVDEVHLKETIKDGALAIIEKDSSQKNELNENFRENKSPSLVELIVDDIFPSTVQIPFKKSDEVRGEFSLMMEECKEGNKEVTMSTENGAEIELCAVGSGDESTSKNNEMNLETSSNFNMTASTENVEAGCSNIHETDSIFYIHNKQESNVEPAIKKADCGQNDFINKNLSDNRQLLGTHFLEMEKHSLNKKKASNEPDVQLREVNEKIEVDEDSISASESLENIVDEYRESCSSPSLTSGIRKKEEIVSSFDLSISNLNSTETLKENDKNYIEDDKNRSNLENSYDKGPSLSSEGESLEAKNKYLNSSTATACYVEGRHNTFIAEEKLCKGDKISELKPSFDEEECRSNASAEKCDRSILILSEKPSLQSEAHFEENSQIKVESGILNKNNTTSKSPEDTNRFFCSETKQSLESWKTVLNETECEENERINDLNTLNYESGKKIEDQVEGKKLQDEVQLEYLDGNKLEQKILEEVSQYEILLTVPNTQSICSEEKNESAENIANKSPILGEIETISDKNAVHFISSSRSDNLSSNSHHEGGKSLNINQLKQEESRVKILDENIEVSHDAELLNQETDDQKYLNELRTSKSEGIEALLDEATNEEENLTNTNKIESKIKNNEIDEKFELEIKLILDDEIKGSKLERLSILDPVGKMGSTKNEDSLESMNSELIFDNEAMVNNDQSYKKTEINSAYLNSSSEKTKISEGEGCIMRDLSVESLSEEKSEENLETKNKSTGGKKVLQGKEEKTTELEAEIGNVVEDKIGEDKFSMLKENQNSEFESYIRREENKNVDPEIMQSLEGIFKTNDNETNTRTSFSENSDQNICFKTEDELKCLSEKITINSLESDIITPIKCSEVDTELKKSTYSETTPRNQNIILALEANLMDCNMEIRISSNEVCTSTNIKMNNDLENQTLAFSNDGLINYDDYSLKIKLDLENRDENRAGVFKANSEDYPETLEFCDPTDKPENASVNELFENKENTEQSNLTLTTSDSEENEKSQIDDEAMSLIHGLKEPESTENWFSDAGGEGCAELDGKIILDNCWLNVSNEDMLLWSSSSASPESVKVSRGVDFESIISAPNLDAALKKLEQKINYSKVSDNDCDLTDDRNFSSSSESNFSHSGEPCCDDDFLTHRDEIPIFNLKSDFNDLKTESDFSKMIFTFDQEEEEMKLQKRDICAMGPAERELWGFSTPVETDLILETLALPINKVGRRPTSPVMDTIKELEESDESLELKPIPTVQKTDFLHSLPIITLTSEESLNDEFTSNQEDKLIEDENKLGPLDVGFQEDLKILSVLDCISLTESVPVCYAENFDSEEVTLIKELKQSTIDEPNLLFEQSKNYEENIMYWSQNFQDIESSELSHEREGDLEHLDEEEVSSFQVKMPEPEDSGGKGKFCLLEDNEKSESQFNLNDSLMISEAISIQDDSKLQIDSSDEIENDKTVTDSIQSCFNNGDCDTLKGEAMNKTKLRQQMDFFSEEKKTEAIKHALQNNMKNTLKIKTEEDDLKKHLICVDGVSQEVRTQPEDQLIPYKQSDDLEEGCSDQLELANIHKIKTKGNLVAERKEQWDEKVRLKNLEFKHLLGCKNERNKAHFTESDNMTGIKEKKDKINENILAQDRDGISFNINGENLVTYWKNYWNKILMEQNQKEATPVILNDKMSKCKTIKRNFSPNIMENIPEISSKDDKIEAEGDKSRCDDLLLEDIEAIKIIDKIKLFESVFISTGSEKFLDSECTRRKNSKLQPENKINAKLKDENQLEDQDSKIKIETDRNDNFGQNKNFHNKFTKIKEYFELLEDSCIGKEKNISPIEKTREVVNEIDKKCFMDSKNPEFRRRKRRTKSSRRKLEKGIIQSAPTSDSEMTHNVRQMWGSERGCRVTERIHIKELFHDVFNESLDRTGLFRGGVPNKSAVLASLRSIERWEVNSSDDTKISTSDDVHNMSNTPRGYQNVYPWIPTTPIDQYRSRPCVEHNLIPRNLLLKMMNEK